MDHLRLGYLPSSYNDNNDSPILTSGIDHRRRRGRKSGGSQQELAASMFSIFTTPKTAFPTYTNQPSLDLELAKGEEKQSSSKSSSTSSKIVERMPLIDEPESKTNNNYKHGEQVDVETGKPGESSSSSSLKRYGSAAGWKEVTAVLLYSFCSVSMILVNKSLASSYNHLIEKPEGSIKSDLNTLLVVFQAAAAVVFLWLCKFFKVLDFPELKWSIVKAWAPVNIFFCLMLFTGMAALQTNSVPMVTVFKNAAIITTAMADYFFFGSQLETLSMVSFGVMLFGAVAAAGNGMETSLLGLFWMVFNCFATTGYVCYMRYATQSIKLTKFGMVYVNNVLCVLFLVPAAYMQGEITMFLNSTALHTWDYGFKNLFAGFVGFFLNFSSLHCVSVTGPTTYAIVGSVNKVPVTVLGYFVFHEKLSRQTWMFVCVSLLGGFLYTYAQIRAKEQDKKQTEANPEANSRK